MKKSIYLLFFLLSGLSALAGAGMKFEKLSWAQVKAKAARENKMIFFDAYTTWCGPCQYLEESVYTDAAVADYFNANFINVKFDMESGEGIDLAEEFGITSYPTLLFFSADGKLVHKYIGAMKAPAFIQLGKDARDPARQYYTLKSEVESNKAGTDAFIRWSTMAEDLEDGNRGSIAAGWLSGRDDIFTDAALLKAVMESGDVGEETLLLLYQNQEKIAQVLGWESYKVSAILYRKLFNLALRADGEGNRGGSGFAALVNRFDTAITRFATIDLEIFRTMNEEGTQAAADLLLSTLQGKDRVNIKDFTHLLIDYSNRFETEETNRLVEALDNYVLQAGDKGQEGWFYLARVICYSKAGLSDKAREAAVKAVADPGLPEHYRVVLTESFDL